MMRDELSVPLIAVGAAGAFALASLLRPRAANAGTSPALAATPRAALARAVSSPAALFDFGRPLPTGTPVLVLADGVVTRAQRSDTGDAGLWVAVRHPSGVTSRYLHLSHVTVDVGQLVRRGDPVGLGGDSGNAKGRPHLHLDLRVPASMLPLIEQAIGRPSTGWGPEMRPFGHSIPGEPFVPVDAYRDRVRDHARQAGIPLRDTRAPRNRGGALVYRSARAASRIPIGSSASRVPLAST